MDKDVTGLAVERAARTLGRVKELFNKRVPYGPTKVQLSKPEMRQKLAQMTDVQRSVLQQHMGSDQWNTLLEDLYGSKR